MKKFWELPLWFFDILDFIKNSILIYAIISFVCWDIDITTWSSIARFTFALGIIVNAIVCFKKLLIMERKIGEKFQQGNVTLKVLKEDQNHWCIGCYYNHGGLSTCWESKTLENRGECRKGMRSDKSGVVFKETFFSRNMRPIVYLSMLLISGVIWYFIFKLFFGL